MRPVSLSEASIQPGSGRIPDIFSNEGYSDWPPPPRKRYSNRMQSPDHEAWEKVLITYFWKRMLTGWRDSLSSQLKDREDLNAIKFLMPHFLSSFLLLFFSFPTPSFSWRLIRVCRAVPCRSSYWSQITKQEVRRGSRKSESKVDRVKR